MLERFVNWIKKKTLRLKYSRVVSELCVSMEEIYKHGTVKDFKQMQIELYKMGRKWRRSGDKTGQEMMDLCRYNYKNAERILLRSQWRRNS